MLSRLMLLNDHLGRIYSLSLIKPNPGRNPHLTSLYMHLPSANQTQDVIRTLVGVLLETASKMLPAWIYRFA
jgi:hypothetical protein